MKLFVFIPIAGYVDNETCIRIPENEMQDRGFDDEAIANLNGLAIGESVHLTDVTTECAVVRVQ
jgi:hypothetical protein